MPSPTYQLIASTTVSSSQASVVFSSIPNTYTDLVIRASARNSADNGRFYLEFNNSSTAVYSNMRLITDGTTASSSQSVNTSYIQIEGANVNSTYTSSTYSNVEIYIPSYTLLQFRPVSSFGVNENNATLSFIGTVAGRWGNNTSAITSIKLVPLASGNFVANSSFFLYGIKNS